ncbi:MAG: Rrf2 family transcriptional regulator [Pirellulaceae bacterium]
MQLPIKAHYATIAMLAIAKHFATGEQVPARLIAGEHEIPSQFLGQILQQLRSAELIVSTRGANGGFRLARAPSAICVADIVDAVCGLACGAASTGSTTGVSQVVNEIWLELAAQQREYLQRLSLDLLLSRCQPAATMFYI